MVRYPKNGNKNGIKSVVLCLCLMLLVLTPATLFADLMQGAVLFLMIGPGARATGMGEAFTAIADDPTATYWNPAGLAQYPLSSQWNEITPPSDDTLTILSIAPFERRGLGVGYKKFDIFVATSKGLYMINEEGEWLAYEEVEAYEDETLLDLLSRVLPYEETERIENNLLMPAAQYNHLDTVEVATSTLIAGQTIKIPYNLLLEANPTILLAGENSVYAGTDKGLYSYDGNQWEKLAGSGAPEQKEILCLFEDERGNLWVGTTDGLFVRQTGRWYHYSLANGLPSKKIYSIYVKDKRYAWVGTDSGPAYFDGAEWSKIYHYNTEGARSWDEVIDSLFHPAVGMRRDYFLKSLKASQGRGEERETPPKEIEVPYRIPFESAITSIYADKQGNVWFGTELGICKFDGKSWRFFGYSSEQITEEITVMEWIKQKWPNLSEKSVTQLEDQIQRYNRLYVTDLKPQDIISYPVSPSSGHIYDIIGGYSPSQLLVGSSFGLLEYKNGFFRYYAYSGLEKSTVHQMSHASSERFFGAENKIVAYSKGRIGISGMHVKWLPELAEDLYYEYLTGTYHLEGWGTFGGALTFLSMGENEWRDEQGNLMGTFTSYDLAFSMTYATAFTDYLRYGMNFKIIYSHLADVGAGSEKGKGIATDFAVDAGLHLKLPLKGLTTGICVQNIGPDIHYIDAAQADPLPRNLRLGLAYTPVRSTYNRLTLSTDFSKDLIGLGEESFSDELDEVIKKVGVEYSYSDFIFLRAGYIDDKEGELFYPTFGAGLRYANFQFDFAYIPKRENLTLSNILRIAVTATF